jgi:hypothetical protein
MTFVGWHGDPCAHCATRPITHGQVQRATHDGLCARHYLAATPLERRLAALDTDPPVGQRITAQIIALELLLALPDAPEPHERAA